MNYASPIELQTRSMRQIENKFYYVLLFTATLQLFLLNGTKTCDARSTTRPAAILWRGAYSTYLAATTPRTSSPNLPVRSDLPVRGHHRLRSIAVLLQRHSAREHCGRQIFRIPQEQPQKPCEKRKHFKNGKEICRRVVHHSTTNYKLPVRLPVRRSLLL